MSADWYDLGGRLRAARCGQPIARLRHAPAPAPVTPVAVRARSTRHGVTVAAATPSTGNNPNTPRRTRDIFVIRLTHTWLFSTAGIKAVQGNN